MNISSVFGHSGYVVDGLTKTFEHVERGGKYLRVDEDYMRRMQRVLESANIGCRNSVKNSFVPVIGGSDAEKKLLVLKVLHVFRK